MFRFQTARIGICTGLIFGMHAALAAVPSATPASGASEVPQLDEIVVTAQKREQSLNDVGLSVSAVRSDELLTRQIHDLDDLAQVLPSVTFAKSASSTPVISIRGVGYYETSLAAYPTVSLYLDQMPLTFPVLASYSNFDLERVEVLKGPQGTLFGENATGGAINFIAAKPTKEFVAGTTLGYGSFNEVAVDGYVGGPLSDTVTTRFAGGMRRADGWQQSTSRPGDKNGAVRTYMARWLLDFKPSDAVSLELNLNAWKDKSQPQAPQYIAYDIQIASFPPPRLLALPFAPAKARAADWDPGLPRSDERMYQTALRADFKLQDALTLTSLTSYIDFSRNRAYDADGTALALQDVAQGTGQIKTAYQELRLSNNGSDGKVWVLGGNVEHSKVNEYNALIYGDTSANLALATLGLPIVGSTNSSEQTMTNFAFFASGEYPLVNEVSLTAGARYTNTKEDVVSANRDVTPPYYIGTFNYKYLAGGIAGPYVPGACYAINNLGYTDNGVPNGYPGCFGGTLQEHNVSWRLGMDWHVAPHSLLYVNIAQGYKGGTFPTLAANVFSQYKAVKQEKVLSYEAGAKLALLDNTLQLDGAVFYYDYADKQLKSRVIDPTFGTLDVLQNIPKSSVSGVEVEATWRPVRRLTLNVAASYLDAKINDFKGTNAAGLSADFSGTRMPFTPKFQATLNGDYEFPMTDRVAGFVGASVNHRSDSIAAIGGDHNTTTVVPNTFPVYGIDGYTLIDARLGVKSAGARTWRAFLWGKNITNRYYWNNVTPGYDSVARFAGKPATYGLTVSYNY